ncbi:unnamed protein product [Linum trigynum]
MANSVQRKEFIEDNTEVKQLTNRSQGKRNPTSRGKDRKDFPDSVSSPVKQDVPITLVVGEDDDESSKTYSADLLQLASRIFNREWFASVRAQLENHDPPKFPLQMVELDVDLLEVVGTTGDDSKHTIAAQNDPCVDAQMSTELKVAE